MQSDLELIPTRDLLQEIDRRCGAVVAILIDPPSEDTFELWLSKGEDSLTELVIARRIIDRGFSDLLHRGHA